MREIVETALAGAFGAVAGTLSGFLGIGGGAILPPLFVFALGMGQHRAQGVSLAALLPPVGGPAVLAYRRRGVVPALPLLLLLIAGFAVGAYAGARVATLVPARALAWAFALFLLISAMREMSPAAASDDAVAPRTSASSWLGLPIGATAGFFSGLLGIGGGLVALPLLRRVARLPRLEAQATTLAMLLPPIGLPAVYVYATQPGGLPWHVLLAVAFGFAAGAWGGASLAGRVNARIASRVYAAFLLMMAALLALRA